MIDGQGASYNIPRALELFQGAAAFGDTRGQFYYAKMLQHGLGGPVKCDSSLEWYQQVAERGPWVLQFEEAFHAYQDGQYESALWMYEKLALQGFPVAQANAAWMYDHNLGCSGSTENELGDVLRPEAEWYYTLASKSKENDYPHLRLAHSYYARAVAVPERQWTEEAAELPLKMISDQWYQRAAFHYLAISQSSGEALYHLGYMHQHGLGVERDLSLSNDYYHVSMDTDSDAAIAVCLSLLSLGGDYLQYKYDSNALGDVLPDTLDYLYPQIFTQFWVALKKDYEKGWYPEEDEDPDDGEDPDDETNRDDDDDNDDGQDDDHHSRSMDDSQMFKPSHAHAQEEDDLDIIIMIVIVFLIALTLLVRGGVVQVQRV